MYVWSEAWLGDENGECRAPLRRQTSFDVNLRVSSLIDHQRRRWNRRCLEELFVPGDVKILMRNQHVVMDKDTWVWRFSRDGCYSVRSGYDLAFSRKHKELIQSQSTLSSINPLKADVWQLLAPPKIKVFIWKALSGAISALDVLRSRGMKCDSVCQTCGMDGESINHILFSCTLARKVWALSNFPSPLGGFHEDSIYQNLSYLLARWKDDKHQRELTQSFPWTLWYLWKNRNSLLFEGCLFDGEQICAKVREESHLWLLAQTMESGVMVSSRVNARQQGDAWKPPDEEEVKCNVGMKWSQQHKILGAAWVLRNRRGEVLLHSRRSFGAVDSKDEAYFLCLAWAIESMFSHKCLNVYFAFECRCLVNAINRPHVWPSFKFKVLEIRLLLRHFLKWRVVFESFEANREARLIAVSASQSSRFQSYVAKGRPVWLSHLFGL